MAEYIEREALIQNMQECKGDSVFNIMATGYAYSFIKNAPAADVVEVVHGEWIRPTMINGRTFDIPHCSVCGDVPCDTKNYCPKCGAKMEKERRSDNGKD